MSLSIDDIKYSVSGQNGHFNLNNGLDEDLSLFILWEDALKKEDEILRDIYDNFTVIANFIVHWSKNCYSRNIQRLYEQYGIAKNAQGYSFKHGKPPFRVVLVKDYRPLYTWKRSVSGVIEPSNERVVGAKYRYRELFDKPYQVHAANNIEEFLVQSSLILGGDNLKRILASNNTIETTLHKDLEGAEGWDSWEHLFSTINPCCRYVVLKRIESVPVCLEGESLDFLTDNMQRFASAANVFQNQKFHYKGMLNVSGIQVPTNIRFLGDNYFSTQWQHTILQRRQNVKGFYTPSKDEYFFILLYYCKVNKFSVEKKYISLLDKMSKEMRFDWFDANQLNNDSAMGELLAGFYKANKYLYEDPIDGGAERNTAVINYLPKKDSVSKVNLLTIFQRLRRLAEAGIREPHKVPRYIMGQLEKAEKNRF